MALAQGSSPTKLRLVKSDFQAAYRCLPVHSDSDHLDLSTIPVADPREGRLVAASQHALLFGRRARSTRGTSSP